MAVGSPQRAPPAVPPAAALLYRHAVGSRPFPLRAAAPGAPPFHLTVDALGTAVRLRAVGPRSLWIREREYMGGGEGSGWWAGWSGAPRLLLPGERLSDKHFSRSVWPSWICLNNVGPDCSGPAGLRDQSSTSSDSIPSPPGPGVGGIPRCGPGSVGRSRHRCRWAGQPLGVCGSFNHNPPGGGGAWIRLFKCRFALG